MAGEIYHSTNVQEGDFRIEDELQTVYENALHYWLLEKKVKWTVGEAKARIEASKDDSSLSDKIDYKYANSLLEEKNFIRYTECITLHLEYAQKIQNKYEIPMAISLAQMLNETDAWTSNLAINNNNYFGLTCKWGDWHNHAKSWCVKKNDVGITQYFMNFKNKVDSRTEYGKRVSTNELYKPCFSSWSLRWWCDGLQWKYAHAKTYNKSLFTIMIIFGLDEKASLPLLEWSSGKVPIKKRKWMKILKKI